MQCRLLLKSRLFSRNIRVGAWFALRVVPLSLPAPFLGARRLMVRVVLLIPVFACVGM